MAQTIDDIEVTEAWQSLNTLTGFAVGVGMEVQFKGGTERVLIAEGTQPSVDSIKGAVIDRDNPFAYPQAGSDEFWVRVENGDCLIYAGES